MLRPEGLLAPHRQGLLLSSFRRLDRSKPASRITTRANSQFPRPDLHRQETRHYGLRAKTQRIKSVIRKIAPSIPLCAFAPLRELLVPESAATTIAACGLAPCRAVRERQTVSGEKRHEAGLTPPFVWTISRGQKILTTEETCHVCVPETMDRLRNERCGSSSGK